MSGFRLSDIEYYFDCGDAVRKDTATASLRKRGKEGRQQRTPPPSSGERERVRRAVLGSVLLCTLLLSMFAALVVLTASKTMRQ